LPLFKKTLRNLNASIGKFAVKGNFDARLYRHLDLFGNTGFELLDCNSVTLDKNGENL